MKQLFISLCILLTAFCGCIGVTPNQDSLEPLYLLNETASSEHYPVLYGGTSQMLSSEAAIKEMDSSPWYPPYTAVKRLGYIYKTLQKDTLPLYELRACCCAYDYCYTTNADEIRDAEGGYKVTRVAGYIFADPQNGTIPLYGFVTGGDGWFSENDKQDPCSHHLIGTEERHNRIIGYILKEGGKQ